MPSSSHRFESRLAASLNGTTSSGPSQCLEAEVLATYADGGLDPLERTACETHLAACDRCREILLAVVETPAVAAPAPTAAAVLPPVSQRPWRWATLAAPVGLAAALMMAIWLAWPAPPAPQESRDAAYRPTGGVAPKELPAGSETRQQDQAPRAMQPPPRVASPETAAPGGAAKVAASAPQRALESRESAAGPADAASPRSETFAARQQNATEGAQATAPTAPASATAANDSTSVLSIVSPSGRVSWMASSAGVIRHDGPAVPSIPAVETGDRLTVGVAVSDTSAWFGGRGGALWHTRDGRTWQRIAVPTTADMSQLVVSGDSRLTVVAGGVRLTTTDDGESWSETR